MLPLRLRLAWLASGWLLVAAVSYGSLMPGGSITLSSGLDKFAHLGGYFFLMTWFCGMYQRSRYPWVAAGLLVLGLALEGLQRWGGYRHFELLDIAANGFGLFLGWLFAVFLLGGWCLKLEQLVFDRT